MSKDLNELRRRLEAITAERCSTDVPEGEESAGLRAAWLAFGKLLEENQAEAGASAGRPEWRQSILTGEDALSAVEFVKSRPSPRRRAPRSRKWLLAAMSVAAASVLVALAVGRSVWTTKPAEAPSPEKIVAKVSPASVNKRPAAPGATTSRTAEWSWDDSTDQTIDQIGWAALQVEQDELASTAGSSSILDEFDAIRKGVNSNSDFSESSPSTQR